MEIKLASFDPLWVILSLVVAFIGTTSGFAIARHHAAKGKILQAALLSGGTFGAAIWLTHHLGMMACRLPGPERHDVLLITISLAISMIASGAGCYLALSRAGDRLGRFGGGLLMAATINHMHYTGMQALILPVVLRQDPAHMLVAGLFSVLLAVLAFRIAFQDRLPARMAERWRVPLAGLLLAAGIGSMHYTSISGVHVASRIDTQSLLIEHAAMQPTMVYAGFSLVLFVVVMLLAMSQANRRYARQTADLTRLGSIIDHCVSEIYLIDPESLRLVYANTQGLDYLKLTPSQWRQLHLMGVDQLLLGQCDWAVLVAPLLQGQADKVSVGIERTGTDGRRLPFHLGVRLSRGPDATFYVLFVDDQTLRFAAEQKLLQSEDRYRATFEHAAVGIARVDLAGHFVSVNPKFMEILGYGAQDFENLDFCALFQAEDRCVCQRDFDAFRAGSLAAKTQEARLLRAGQTPIWAHLELDLVQEGADRHLIVVLTDVTKVRQAEDTLRESRARLEMAISAADCYTWELDVPSGAIWLMQQAPLVPGHANPATHDRPFVTQAVFMRWLHPADRETVRQHLLEANLPQHSLQVECRLRTLRGWRWYHIQGQRVPDQSERPARMIGVISDITDRKRMEYALIESEEDYRATFEQAAVGITHSLLDGRLIRANRRYAEILGYSVEEVLQKGYLELSHPDDRAATSEAARQLMAGEIPVLQMEKRYLRSDGSVVWGHLTTSLRRDPLTGAPRHFIAVLQDISARKMTEIALAESRKQLDFAMQAGSLGTWEIWPAANELHMSAQKAVRIGLPEEPVIMAIDAYIMRVHGDDREGLLQAYSQAVGTHTPLQAEYRIVQPGGEIRWLQCSGVWLGEENAPDRRLVGITRDTTQTKRAEEVLRESENRLQMAMDAAALGTWDWNLTSNRIWGTDSVPRMFGLPPGDYRMQDYLERIHPDDVDRVRERLNDAIDQGRNCQVEFRVPVYQTGPRWLTVMAAPGRDAMGQINRVIGVLADISIRKRMEIALMESEERFRSTFEEAPVGIAHLSLDGQLLNFNRRLCEITAYTEEEMRDLTFRDIIHPDDLPTFLAFMAEMRNGARRFYSMENRYITRPGRPVWVNLSVSGIRDSEDHVRYYICIVEDITDRRRADETRAQLANLVSFSNDAIFSITQEGMISSWNAGATAMFGHTASDIVGQPVSLIIPAELAEEQAAIQEQITRGLTVENLETRRMNSDGHLIDVSISISPLRDASGNILGASCIARDITRSKRDAENLRLLRRALESSMSGIVISDITRSDQPVIYVNPAFEAITGYSEEDVLGKNCRFLQGTEPMQPGVEEIRLALRENREARVMLRNYRKDGSLFYNELYIAPVREASGKVTHYVGAVNDRTEQKRYEAQLEYQAGHDTLTDLPNRMLLADRLRQAIAWCEQHRQNLAVLFIDLDRFKHVNDSTGHVMGDDLLRAVASRLQGSVHETDTVARLGGDEFVVVLRELPAGNHVITPRVNQIMAEINKPYPLDGHEFSITSSVGVAVWPRDGRSGDELLKNADIAMYRAKEQGRNRFSFYSEEMNRSLQTKLGLEKSLRQALEREEFVLHYQPIVALGSGTVIGMEALLRWNDPQRGLIQPQAFLPMAEETGLIHPIGEWMLLQAARQVRLWQGVGYPELLLTVKASEAQIRGPGFAQRLEELLSETGLAADSLELAWREVALAKDAEVLIQHLRRIKEHGLRLALDDFGVGYTGLAQLRHLPIDTLRLHGAVIRNITTDPGDAAIASAVIAMARGLGLLVSADGVESRGQIEFLRKQEVDRLQGRYFCAPLEAEEAKAFLLAGRTLQLGQRETDASNKRLLIVDDEPNIISSLRRLLREDGYDILVAHSAHEAFEILADQEIGVILSDQRMPGMNGTEFLARVKTLYPGTMRIVLSGYTDLNSVTDAINRGAVYKFLTKPWDNTELRDVVRDAFQRYRTVN